MTYAFVDLYAEVQTLLIFSLSLSAAQYRKELFQTIII